VDPGDQFVHDGDYFAHHPSHILGTEVGKDSGDDDQTAKPRWGYQVVGTFERLPDLVERPICGACEIQKNVVVFPGASARSARTGMARQLEASTEGLPEHTAAAVALGLRVDRYLAALSAQRSDEHVQLWPELHEALTAWARKHGNPWVAADLRKLVAEGNTGAERFLQGFTKSGALIEGLATKPVWTPRYAGKPEDLVALAEWAYRTRRALTVRQLGEALAAAGGAASLTVAARLVERALPDLHAAGWCLDGEGWDQLVPERDYLTGHLWPKHTRAAARVDDAQAAAQARKLVEKIQPVVLDDIGGVSPRQGWVSLDLVSAWVSESLNHYYGAVRLERREGLVQVPGLDYDRIEDASELAAETRWCIGWINHDKTTFSPKKKKLGTRSQPDTRVRARWLAPSS
jgi:hypothetical protein